MPRLMTFFIHMKWPLLLSLTLWAVSTAQARDSEGALGLIITPNNGIPALILPDQTFEALLREKAQLKLRSGETVLDISAEWTEVPGGKMKALCSIPPGAAPGPYTLEATTDSDSEPDQNVRAVYVYQSFPETYTVAHLTDTHVGTGPESRNSEAILTGIVKLLNESEAAFVLITGDLTENGDPDQFRTFLRILDGCRMPTFVCPGEHDRNGKAYERFFGTTAYAFRFGLDGYLSFDTKDYLIADELGPQDALLERLRRRIKPSRWSVGFTHRYDPAMGMRSQIALFIDNPLDFLLFGHRHREQEEDEVVIPWGNTPALTTPAAKDGAFRLIEVTAKNPRPYPTRYLSEAD